MNDSAKMQPEKNNTPTNIRVKTVDFLNIRIPPLINGELIRVTWVMIY
jgi:hypothetical protein